MSATSKQQGRDRACSSLGVLRPGSTEPGGVEKGLLYIDVTYPQQRRDGCPQCVVQSKYVTARLGRRFYIQQSTVG